MNERPESEFEISVPEGVLPEGAVPEAPAPETPVPEVSGSATYVLPEGHITAEALPPAEEPPIMRHDPFAYMRGAPWMNRSLSPSGRAAAFLRRELDAFPVIEGRDPNRADLDGIVKRTVDYMVPIFKRERATDITYDELEKRRAARIVDKREADLTNRDPNIVRVGAGDTEVQIAQQTKPQTPPRQAPRSSRPVLRGPEHSADQITWQAENRREAALADVHIKDQREARTRQWDDMLRQFPIPTPPGSRIQAPLPQDWRAAINRIDPRYVKFTEDAAKRHGIPTELLARLFYRESNYKNENNDGAQGIPQMRGGAIKDVGLDPRTFGSIGADKQIDAGAAYLAKQYRALGDWPKAVAAYHLGAGTIRKWHSGREAGFDSIAGDPDVLMNPGNADKRKDARDALDRWRGLETYLPYIFLGDPNRYGGGVTR